ncbi:MAG: hypothetical protein P8I56_19465 [Paracoccaceae bacterium]|jgi:hypothetical protein|nr:hypothetical protein [Paracoccaceae bacterium]
MTSPSEKGAALLEVLIAVAITAMLAAALTQVTRFGLSVIERVQTANSSSTEALIARRTLSDLLTRIDPGKADRDTAQGDRESFQWYGAAPDGDAWRTGIWRLQTTGDQSELSLCVEFGVPATCSIESTIQALGPFAYAPADGVFADVWPAGPPPHLIRIGDHVFTPRALGGR